MQELPATARRDHSDQTVVIIGAGPGGLTAAYLLAKQEVPCVVLEKDDQVGGISRTARHNGYLFDIGGHRFFTKVEAVERFWHEVMDEGDFLLRKRLSRIHYQRRFFDYPLRASNALFGLGIAPSVAILASYAWAKLFPIPNERTFEHWVTNRFGRRLYETFFKTYTEKVWGIPCSQLSADWAAQRIRGLSLMSAIRNALLPRSPSHKRDVIKTLIDSFHYPRRGPGQLWEIVADRAAKGGARVQLNAEVERIIWNGLRVAAVEVSIGARRERIDGSHFISTMPIRELIAKSDPAPPKAIVQAANRLNYRDFLTVALIVDTPDLFPDNWIYIHDPAVRVGRVQNFKNWSPDMVPDPNKTCVGLEYFCFEGDGLWTMSDDDLVALAKREMETLGLLRADDVEDGVVIRMPKAYPVYDGHYREALDVVQRFVASVENLQLIGRNGMHKYNNQDHSMLTAMLAVENILGADHDIWSVNVDASYHEEQTRHEHEKEQRDGSASLVDALAATQPHVPLRVTDTTPDLPAEVVPMPSSSPTQAGDPAIQLPGSPSVGSTSNGSSTTNNSSSS